MELKALRQLNFPTEKQLLLDNENARKPWEFIPAGHKIGTPEPIFKELVCTSPALIPWTLLLILFSWFLFSLAAVLIGISYFLWNRKTKMWRCSGKGLLEVKQIEVRQKQNQGRWLSNWRRPKFERLNVAEYVI